MLKLQSKAAPKEKVPLHKLLRPKDFDGIIGQGPVVKALKRDSNHYAFLFTGPSGVGKTTLARLVAKTMNAELVEVDAASESGVENTRAIVDQLAGPRLSDRPIMVIIDECHTLSKQAWQPLLKVMEEPPQHLRWALCTTDISKVPDTIRTRCATFDLKPIKPEVMRAYMGSVVKYHKLQIADDLLDAIVEHAGGSVRQGLIFLEVLNGVKDKTDVEALLSAGGESSEIIDFVRYICFAKPQWGEVCKKLKAMKESGVPAETIRIVMVNYITAVALNKTSDGAKLLHLMAQFSVPYPASDKYGPLLLSCGNIVLA